MKSQKKLHWHKNPQSADLVAKRFDILSKGIRLLILRALQKGPLSVAEITLAVHANQSNVSKHLKTLHEGGVLHRQQVGNTVYYSIADKSVLRLCETAFDHVRQHMLAQIDKLTETG